MTQIAQDSIAKTIEELSVDLSGIRVPSKITSKDIIEMCPTGHDDGLSRTRFKDGLDGAFDGKIRYCVVQGLGIEGLKGSRRLVPDPYGPYDVDFAITIDDKIVGLVEVDHFQKWERHWPQNYTKVHFLARKFKYFNGPKGDIRRQALPYLHFTFNKSHTEFLCYSKYSAMHRHVAEIQIRLGNRDITDRVVKIPKPEVIISSNSFDEIIKDHTPDPWVFEPDDPSFMRITDYYNDDHNDRLFEFFRRVRIEAFRREGVNTSK